MLRDILVAWSICKDIKTMRENSVIRTFFSNRHGNTAVMFAVSVLPLMLVAGGSVDLIYDYNLKSKMQKAVDAAALEAAAARNLTKKQRKKAARKAFYMNFKGEGASALGAKPVVRVTKKAVYVSAQGQLPTRFIKLIGINSLNVKAAAVAKRNYGNLELAIVLDNTYSMKAGGKIGTLVSAAKTLVNTLYNSDGGDKVKIALAPFTRYVRLDKKYKNAPWLKVPPKTSIYVARHCRSEPEYEDYNCREVHGSSFLDGILNFYTYTKCDSRPTGRMIKNCWGGYTSTHEWRGCVGSRPAPWNKRDSNYAKRIPALKDINECPQALVPLTGKKHRNKILSVINAMTPRDSQTYVPAGLIWGWRLLSHNAPFAQGKEYSNKNHKALVLMTDGANTVIANGKYHDAGPKYPKAPEADKLTARLCENIKAKGIRLYTVAFKVSDAKTKAMLQNCATGPSDYFDASDNAKLTRAFKKIGKDLATVYLAK